MYVQIRAPPKPFGIYYTHCFVMHNVIRVEMHKNWNNVDIGIRGFTMWKQKIQWQNVTPSEYWTPGHLIPSPTLSFLHLLGICL